MLFGVSNNNNNNRRLVTLRSEWPFIIIIIPLLHAYTSPGPPAWPGGPVIEGTH